MTEKITISLPAYQWEAILRGLASSGWDGMHAVLSHELSEVRAGVVAEEPEWEWGVARERFPSSPAYFHCDREACERFIENPPLGIPNPRGPWLIMQRRKAGPWVPVKQEGGEER